MLRNSVFPVLIATVALALGLAPAPAGAASPGTTVVRLDAEADLTRPSAPADPLAPGSLSAPVVVPSEGPWFVPFVVEPGDPVGTTTLLAVRNDSASATADVLVEFFSAAFNEFHTVELTLQPRMVQSFNLRDQPNLPAPSGGLTYGLVRVTAGAGEPISVDHFRVDPGDDFATGSLSIDFPVDECFEWKGRILQGGPFSGGTSLTFIVDGPRGGNQNTDPPTVSINVYPESGSPGTGFNIFTDAFVFEIDAEELVGPGTFTGSFELVIDGTDGGGFVIVENSAEGRYSVSLDGVCLDTLVTAE